MIDLPASRWQRHTARLIAAASFTLIGSLAIAQTSDPPASTAGPRLGASAQRDAAAPATSGAAKAADRQREGTRLTDERGAFQTSGDRIAFQPTGGGKDSYRVLENLALQRISFALDDSRGQGQWLVSGIITEYRGANYLLITKANIAPQEREGSGIK
jgi:hypothetical protein